MERTFRYIAGTLFGVLLIGVLAFFAFIYSGVYNIGASDAHFAIVRWVFVTAQKNAVKTQASTVEAPALDDAGLVRRGFALYQTECLVCHGAPGVARDRVGRGLNPTAPPLITQIAHWTDAEVFWIIENGLKMTGMPGFGTGLTHADIWALTAFVRRLPELSQEEYLAMVGWSQGVLPAAAVEWVEDDDPGFLRLVLQGDADRGRALLDAYGCGACHEIPGIRAASGLAGPPLDHWAERHFIAGALINTPDNLVRFIADPQAVEPGTVMPNLGVSPQEALDMAAYLFTLGDPPLALHTVQGTREPEREE